MGWSVIDANQSDAAASCGCGKDVLDLMAGDSN